MGRRRLASLILILFIIDVGVAYPVVTHWAWSGEGWLAQGIDIDHDGEDITIAYRVRERYIYIYLSFLRMSDIVRHKKC